jgi:Holliday junction resolvase RusA-like endonuclease
MHEISFFLPIIPYGKGRARTFVRNGVNRTITPTKTRNHANELKALTCIELLKQKFKKPFDGPIEVYYMFYLPRPKSVKTRKYPTVKPDSDNAEKQINDNFNQLIWIDDTQIVNTTIMKRYAENTAQVGISVRIVQIMSKEQNEVGVNAK